MTSVKRSDNPNDLYVHHLATELRKVSAQYSLDARVKACKELAQIFYHGGVLESHLVEDSRSIETILGIIQNQKEPACLRIQALQTLSSLCILADEVNRVLHSKHAMQLMIRQFRDGNEMIRKWSVHCAFLLALKNHRRHGILLQGQRVNDLVTSISMEDWSKFRCNDAERLLTIIEDTK
ncbi:hypothetical protein HDU78_005491 [Chytriomyces hyalinus]|nr:hypothetical protein HDU78_005491 [Chytriomyces hyalinus]